MAKKIEETTTVVTEQVEVVSRVGGLMRLFELERSFLIFALIYFPVAWLFLGRGYLENFLLAIYTVVMIILAVMMIAKFVLHLATAADNRGAQSGRLFVMYLIDGLVPLAMLKVFGHILNMILPFDRHQGIVCDLVRLFRQFYYEIFQFQTTLNYVIIGGLVITFVAAVWAVTKNNE